MPDFHVYFRILSDFSGFSVILLDSLTFFWILIDSYKFFRILSISFGFFLILSYFALNSRSPRNLVRFPGILSDSAGFSRFLSDSIRFFRILSHYPGFFQTLSNSLDLFWILPDSFLFCWNLTEFSCIFSGYLLILWVLLDSLKSSLNSLDIWLNSLAFSQTLLHSLFSNSLRFSRFLSDSFRFSPDHSEFDWILLNSFCFLGFFRILFDSLGFWPNSLVYSRILPDSLSAIVSKFLRTLSYSNEFTRFL